MKSTPGVVLNRMASSSVVNRYLGKTICVFVDQSHRAETREQDCQPAIVVATLKAFDGDFLLLVDGVVLNYSNFRFRERAYSKRVILEMAESELSPVGFQSP